MLLCLGNQGFFMCNCVLFLECIFNQCIHYFGSTKSTSKTARFSETVGAHNAPSSSYCYLQQPWLSSSYPRALSKFFVEVQLWVFGNYSWGVYGGAVAPTSGHNHLPLEAFIILAIWESWNNWILKQCTSWVCSFAYCFPRNDTQYAKKIQTVDLLKWISSIAPTSM